MRLLSLFTLILFACEPVGRNAFSDETIQIIASLQDRRRTDSLLLFLDHPEARYRLAAAMALASVQDSSASGKLGAVLLEDPDPEVRKSAAFALGQTPGFASANALIAATGDLTAQFEVLEGLGKIVSREDLGSLLTAEDNDSITLLGKAWGSYRSGARSVTDSATVVFSRRILEAAAVAPAQFAAAHYFNRSSYPPAKGVEEALIRTLRSWSADTRMAAVGALRKFNSEACLRSFNNLLEGEDDYRVKVAIMRTLAGYTWAQASRFFENGLKESNPNVGIAAAEVIRNMAGPEQLVQVLAWARSATNPRTQALLYEAALAGGANEEVRLEVVDVCRTASNPYQKSWLLLALSRNIASYPFIREQLFSPGPGVVKSSAADALVRINRNKSFDGGLKKEFVSIYQQIVGEGDLGAIISACEALKDPVLGYKDIISDVSFLKNAAGKLSLPKDIETLQPLQETIAYFEGTTMPPPKNVYNNPIDWALVGSIPSNQRVLIETSKGRITLQLFVDEAPGSVANFVKLVNQKYFDGKYFHRVVPNFVVQTGCHRGDGFGSEDYSIRSEFSGRRYKTGSVGMASAGKDTEGTQWFITHSPAPHLDGRYSIFAEVVEGMSVVHQIEVGDQIVAATLVGH